MSNITDILEAFSKASKGVDITRPITWEQLINVLKHVKDENGITEHQKEKMSEISDKGYKWNREESGAAAGVVMEKWHGGKRDFWFFGLDGEIMHNP